MKSSCVVIFSLKPVVLVLKEDDKASKLNNDVEEATLWNVLEESKKGNILVPSKPLPIFVFPRVAFPLIAAPDKQENVVLLVGNPLVRFSCLTEH